MYCAWLMISQLPDSIKDEYIKAYSQAPSANVLTFCKRELFNRVWLLILDGAFMEMYEHGFKVKCGDGVVRCIFPRFFTYSANYPEKMLIAALKPLTHCLCPHCLTTKDQVAEARTRQDKCCCAHSRVDDHLLHNSIACARRKHIKDQLDARSLNPIQNTFSTWITSVDPDCNSYEILMPDLMHNMRKMPTFGHDRIWKFWHNVASQKKLATRNYEAFLQTIMPAFEGLLPLHDDQTVADLLFELANWHALAKLCLHTNVTLDIFHAATQTMYEAVHTFEVTTCANYTMFELPNEAQVQARCQMKSTSRVAPSSAPKHVNFNVMNTFKYHSLGPMDNYTTQVFYARTNKDAKRTRAEARTRVCPDSMELSAPMDQYSISRSQHSTIILLRWLNEHCEDLATKDFRSLLVQHLLKRFLGCPDQEDDPFTEAEQDGLQIYEDRLYRHKVLRINYTTYDMHHEQDLINPRTHPDIAYVGPGATCGMQQWQDMPFLWVRWFERFKHRRLPHLQFVDAEDPDLSAFSFIDPYNMVHVSYLMLAFAHGVARMRVATTNGDHSDQCEDPDDEHDCSEGKYKDSDSKREDSDDVHNRSDSGREDSGGECKGSDGKHEGSDVEREGSDSGCEGSDSGCEGSDSGHEGSDGGHEGLGEGEAADEGDIDMGSEVEMSDSESGSDEDGCSDDSDKDPDSGSNDDREDLVDTMYAPLGFAPL
ncbi:hypothetical protein V8D89_010538 [Ganoderma adspersum]